MPSGATNRSRQRAAEVQRQVETERAPRRLAHLSPEQAVMARKLMDQILAGDLTDPDRPRGADGGRDEHGR